MLLKSFLLVIPLVSYIVESEDHFHVELTAVISQIRLIERNQEIPHKGAFCDLVWSDPEEVLI